MGHLLNLGDEHTDATLVDALRGKPGQWSAAARDYPIQRVDDAPLLANEVPGDEVDLLRFPSPRWHERRRRPFHRHRLHRGDLRPGIGELNGGCYRMKVRDNGRSVTVNPVPGKHGAQHIQKWFAQGGPGAGDGLVWARPVAAHGRRHRGTPGASELEYAGAVIGRGCRRCSGRATGLPIPAGSEIAVEGWLYPDDVARRGAVRRMDRL